jgi:hypothetical protein
MAMLVFENVYILVEEEGVLCHENGKETRIAWSELEGVALDRAPGFLVFSRANAAPLRWYMGRNAKEVQDKLEDTRRKALHGLLRPSSKTGNPPRA